MAEGPPDLRVADPESLAPLKRVLERLRGPGGCLWDREQSPESLRPFILEEAHELVEAIDRGEPAAIREELGDVLLQVVFQAQFAEEQGRFHLPEVIAGIAEKLIERHPHVFGSRVVRSAEEVLANWERDKLARAGRRRESLLDGVPRSLPALARAQRVQQRAAAVGFDWEDAEGPLAKVKEELGELTEVARGPAGEQPAPAARLEEELGDLFFAAVNLARKLGVDAESALRRAVEKFAGRFQAIERLAAASGRDLAGMSLAEMDELWERVKEGESGTGGQ